MSGEGPWVDRHQDVWTLGADGLLHATETAPFPREHVERKWGPLRAVSAADLPLPYRPRVSFTFGSITKVVTARRRYVCANHLSGVEKHYIEVGDRHAYNRLPPHNREIGNENWWQHRHCLDCCPIEYDERVLPSSMERS